MKFATSIVAALLLIAPALAQTPSMDASLRALLANPKVVKTLDDLKADDARTLEEQKRITEIPAPPFKEKVRAEYYLKRMQELGLKDASIDSEGNVIALRKGTGGGRPKLACWSRRRHQAIAGGAAGGEVALAPHPEERQSRVSKDAGPSVASWFETRFALLTMRGL